MQARVLGLLAVCVAIALVAYLLRGGRQDDQREQDSADLTQPAEAGRGTPAQPEVVARDSTPRSTPGTVISNQPPEARNPAIAVVPPADGTAPFSAAPRPPMPSAAPPIPPPVVGAVPPGPVTGGADIPAEEIAKDVDKVTLSLRDYRTIMGENPTGTNAEIAKALNGANPKQARLLQEGLLLNRDGELIDRWGTPYFFHQLSKEHMQIRSAGADKRLWTEDDVFSN